MFRVPPFEVLFDLMVAAIPKAHEITRDLHWSMSGRQQFDDQGHATRSDCRMTVKAEELLYTN